MTGFRGPDKLQRKAASVFIQRHKMSASDDFERDQEEHSGGTSLDGRLDEVRSSLTVPVDSMVQFQVADEDELHQKDAASVPTTSEDEDEPENEFPKPAPAATAGRAWASSDQTPPRGAVDGRTEEQLAFQRAIVATSPEGSGDKAPAADEVPPPPRKRTPKEARLLAQDEARKRLKAWTDHWKSLTSSERKALQDSILGEAQPQQTPEQEELCSSDEQFLPSPTEGDDEEDEEKPPRVCRHCNATQHGEESDARDHEAKCCATLPINATLLMPFFKVLAREMLMQLSQLLEVEMVVEEEEVVEVGAEDIQTEPCSPAIVATAPEGSEDNPIVLD